MKAHLLMEGTSTANPAATSKVSRKRLRERAVELAVLDGRAPQDAGKSDWEMAKRELSGEPDEEPEPKAPLDNNTQSDSNPADEMNHPTPGWLS